MTILALGPEGTFSHELAFRLFGEEVELVPTIHRIFVQVEKGGVQGLIPLENSEAGGVGPTLDGLLRYRVFIQGEVYMPVHHYLVSKDPVDKAERLFVHPQTHEQCSELVDSLEIPVIHTSSNAESARDLLKCPRSAAIVSLLTTRIHALPVIRERVENNPSNVTRFVLISSTPGPEDGARKCSIIVDPKKDRSGLLHDLLGIFARRGINLTRIESRPSKRGMGSYVFFVDFLRTGDCRDALAELTGMTSVKYLGCYSQMGVPEWK